MPRSSTTRRGNGPGAGQWGGPAKGAGHRFTEGDPLAGRPVGVKNGEGKRARAAELARQHVEDAIEVWRSVMTDPTAPPAARIAAAAQMVERAEGKPVQPVEVREADPDSMTDEELAAIASRGSRATAGEAGA